MKKLLILVTAFLFAACGGTGSSGTDSVKADSSNKIEMTLDGKTSSFEPKDGAILILQQGSGEKSKAQYQILLSTYELKKGADSQKVLTAPDENLIALEVYNKEGTTRDTPLAPETFSAEIAGSTKTNASFGSVFVNTFADGKEIRKKPADFLNEKRSGSVTFTDVSGDTVKGTVDLTLGEKLKLKGEFTAKVKPRGF